MIRKISLFEEKSIPSRAGEIYSLTNNAVPKRNDRLHTSFICIHIYICICKYIYVCICICTYIHSRVERERGEPFLK